MLAANSRDALARALIRALTLITCSASKSDGLEEFSEDYLSLKNDNQVSNRDVFLPLFGKYCAALSLAPL